MKATSAFVGIPTALVLLVGCTGAAASKPTPTAPVSPALTVPATAKPTTAPTASPSPRPSASPSPTPKGPLQIVTGGNLSPSGVSLWYTPGNITVARSEAVFELVNPAGGVHNVMISEEVGGEVLAGQTVQVGQTATLDATEVAPGTYKIWCSIPDHVKFGMVGTLTITK